MPKRRTLDQLQTLPGIGPNLAQDLKDLGFHDPVDLCNQDPEKMYTKLCELRGQKIDRCVLYAFRCAVHSVTSDGSEPELLKWWNWKDRNL
jgi:hypothetical protein